MRDNIASFGGDPSRITLFGQSAGAAAIDFYSYAWTADPIASAFISESGVATSFVNPTPLNNTATWYTLVSNVGCGGASTPLVQTVACMRTKSTADILAGEAKSGLQFNPSVDSKTVFADYDSLTAQGKFIKAPVLLGNNDYEAGIIKVILAEQGITQSLDAWALLNLQTWTCPIGTRAREKAAQGVPVWRYRWYGEFANTRLTVNPDSGAWHGSEIAAVFGTTSGSGVADSQTEISILTYLIGAWTGFAKNPRTALAAQPYGWPTYNQDKATLVRLAYANQTHASFVYPVTYDYACPYIYPVLNQTALAGVKNLTQLGGGSEIGY